MSVIYVQRFISWRGFMDLRFMISRQRYHSKGIINCAPTPQKATKKRFAITSAPQVLFAVLLFDRCRNDHRMLCNSGLLTTRCSAPWTTSKTTISVGSSETNGDTDSPWPRFTQPPWSPFDTSVADSVLLQDARSMESSAIYLVLRICALEGRGIRELPRVNLASAESWQASEQAPKSPFLVYSVCP